MSWLIAIALIAVAVALASKKQPTLDSSTLEAARQLHSLSGDYPAHCSWCKKTTLARRMTILERQPHGWTVLDLDELAATQPPAEAAAHCRALFTLDDPATRRLCSDPCVQAFLAQAGPTAARLTAQLHPCSYCHSQYLRDRHKCPNCGAPA